MPQMRLRNMAKLREQLEDGVKNLRFAKANEEITSLEN